MKRGSTSSSARMPTPSTSAVRFVWSRYWRNWRISSTNPSASVEKPNSFGQLTHDDGDGQAVHVADLDLLGEQVGDEAELAEPEADLEQPDHHGEHARQHDGLVRIVPGHDQRSDGGEDQGEPPTSRARAPGPGWARRSRSRSGRRWSCRDRSPEAGRRARRRPCPAARGWPRGRCRRPGRTAGRSGGRCAPSAAPEPTAPGHPAQAHPTVATVGSFNCSDPGSMSILPHRAVRRSAHCLLGDRVDLPSPSGVTRCRLPRITSHG